MSNKKGHRGYIGSRPYYGERAPQHVQNLVIRDFCERNGHQFLLSATEYIMDGCYMILEEVMLEIDDLDGIVLYSIFMLPKDKDYRNRIVRRALAKGVEICGAVERLSIRNEDDLTLVNDIWAVKDITDTSRHMSEVILHNI